MEKCPALAPHMQKDGQCTYKGLVVNEVSRLSDHVRSTQLVVLPLLVDSIAMRARLTCKDNGLDNVLSALPGNNPIWGSAGPHPAAGYTEKGLFVNVADNATTITPPGPGKQYAQINAGPIQ